MKRVLSIFLLLLLSFTLLTRVHAAGVKFMALSDVHIKTGKNSSGEYETSESIKNLQKAVKTINHSNADFAVFLGDNIDVADKDMLVIFAKIIGKIKKPVYVILGNHDAAQALGLDKKEYFRLLNKFSHNKIKKVPCVKKMPSGLVFIFMDGVNEFIPGPKGNFKDAELLWLEKQLNKHKKDKIVIIQHFPLVEPYDHKSHYTYNAENYLKLLSRYNNIMAVFSGHYHFEKTTEKDGVTHISLPTLYGSGEFMEVELERKGGGKYFIKTKTHNVN